jgi:hypothetical protein
MYRLGMNSSSIRAVLGLLIAIGLGATRTEKLWAEEFNGWSMNGARCSLPDNSQEPFDPRRVPPSGGMASRLLSQIKVKPVE